MRNVRGAAMERLRAQLAGVPDNPLRELRRRKGLKQEDVARTAEMKQQNLSAAETGNRYVTDEMATKLARGLGESPKRVQGDLGLAALKAEAESSNPDPAELLELLLYVDARLPETGELQALRVAVVEAIEEALASYKEAIPVATKTATTRKRRRRDTHGRVVEKEFDPDRRHQAEPEPERGANGRITRDAHGRVKNKPNDPSRYA